MYKARDGIYYKNFLYRVLGIASPSLNMAHGGMWAIRQKACTKAERNARKVDKWEIRRMRRNKENVRYMGTAERKGIKYAVYECQGKNNKTERAE